MTAINLFVGSTLGATEYVADRLADQLRDQGFSPQLFSDFSHWQLEDAAGGLWLVCTSTHGAGDLPDNIQPFADYLLQQRPNLSHVRYAVVAIGDSSYDTFCDGGKKLDAILESLHAVPLLDRLEIDIQAHPLPEDEAERWLPQLLAAVSKTCA